jgi:hypothetical protein
MGYKSGGSSVRDESDMEAGIEQRPDGLWDNRSAFAADMLFNGAAEQNFLRKIFDYDRFEVEEQSFLLPTRKS